MTILYDIKKDAENYARSLHKFPYFTHGRNNVRENLLFFTSPEIQKVIKEAKDEKEAYQKVINILKNDNGLASKMEKTKEILTDEWEKKGKQIISNLEFIFKKEFPFPDIKVYLTSIPICPHNFKEKYFFVFAMATKTIQLRIIEHELNHFMFYNYYSQLKNILENEKYELLKESLTFFSNPEEEGKPNEKELRKMFMEKIWNNLDEAINEAVERLKKQK
ncbi:MAG: hypothetical protein PHZ25_03300 [Candidatus Pacebacteria bacterium]|nr:hypothetical protein [Candidatus Paceibacterota bacterium]